MIRMLRVVSTAMVLLCAGCTGLPSFTQQAPLPAGLPLAEDSFTLADGARVPVRTWQPPTQPGERPAAVILALHGFNDSRDAWALPGPMLAAAGIVVYAPDQRGFGAAPGRGMWPGDRALADDAAAMLATLRARHPGVPLFAMGESMGGAVLMTLAARPDRPAIDGWILLAPAVWGRAQQGIGAQQRAMARVGPGPQPHGHGW